MAIINGTASSETLTGTAAADTISGLGGNDVLNGGNGNDTLIGGAGADVLNGGAGIDYASYSTATAAVSINLATGVHTGDAAGDTYSDIEGFVGTAYHDTFVGGAGNDTFFGGGEWDTIDYSNATSAISAIYTGTTSTGFGTITGTSTGTDVINVVEEIIGSKFDDVLASDAYYSSLQGNLGNDIYIIGHANVKIFEDAGEGTDTVQTALASYTLGANVENLTYTGSSGFSGIGNSENNVITSGSGNDSLTGGAGNDTLNAGGGDDTLLGGAGADILNGGLGNDLTSYASSTSAISINLMTGVHSGDASGDTFNSIESFIGTAYRDTFVGGAGNDSFSGGGGVDTIDYSNATSAISAIYTGTTSSGFGTITGTSIGTDVINVVEEIIGSQFDDVLASDAFYSSLHGNLGNDTYIIGHANVKIFEDAGEGIDTVKTVLATYTLGANFENLTYTGSSGFKGYGNSSDNIIIGGIGADTLYGYDGDDFFTGGSGSDTIYGGNGTDTSSYSSSNAGVAINLITGVNTGGYATGEILSSIENIIGSAYGDTITGDANANVISGLDGDDFLSGGDGNDTIEGGAGWDTISGGNGTDTLTYAAATGGVSVDLVSGHGSGGIAAGDAISGIEVVIGSGYADTFKASVGVTLAGGLGDDIYVTIGSGVIIIEENSAGIDEIQTSLSAFSLEGQDNIENLTYAGGLGNFTGTGNALDNIIYGGHGDDLLYGGDGNDRIYGGSGSNLMFGGAGNDYLFSSGIIATLDGGSGDDHLQSLGHGSVLLGGDGNDIFSASGGPEVLNGGAGNDTVSYNGVGVVVNLDLGIGLAGEAAGDTLIGIENLGGTSYNDTLISSLAGTLNGVNGDDLYIVGSADVVVRESGGTGTGTDTVQTSISSYTLGNYVENLVFTGSGAFTATGNSLDNTLAGGAGHDVISGLDGNDTLDGGAGGDTINGGNGTDRLTYAASSAAVAVNLVTGIHTGGDAAGDVISSIEIITGSAFADTFTAAGVITLEGGAGNDTYIIDGSGVTIVEAAGAGTDTVRTSLANYALDANIENLVYTGALSVTLTGNGLNNALTGGNSDDVLVGGDGNDTLIGGAGADVLSGGNGTDAVSYATSTSGVSINLSTFVVSGGDAAGDVLTGIEAVIGSAFADTLVAASAATLIGGAGDDIYIVNGNGNGVVLSEGAGGGTDVVEASINSIGLASNIEVLTFTGIGNFTATGNTLANVITGGAGDDVVIGGAGGDTLVGGLGTDTASYQNAGVGVVLDFATGINTGDAAGDVYSSIESFVGSSYDDTFIGDGNANQFNAGNGNDSLVGGAGADVLNGGGGTDTADYSTSGEAINIDLSSGLGIGGDAEGDVLISIERLIGSNFADTFVTTSAATLVGGLGDDVYDIGGSTSVVTEAFDAGIDTILTSRSAWTLGDNVENLHYAGSDAFVGTGNGLDNVIDGGTGADALSGEDGNDVLNGGEGADTLTGGLGADSLSGGSDADRFVFTAAAHSDGISGVDRIGDFSQSDGDLIDVSAIGSLSFIGTTAFSGVAGELRYETVGDDTFVFADMDGDAIADFEVELAGVTTLSQADFVL